MLAKPFGAVAEDSATGIHAEGHLLDIRPGFGHLGKFEGQRRRQIVHTEEAHILEHTQGCALAGAADTGHNDDM